MKYQDYIKKEGEFEYLERGEGHVILILHGLFGALSNFGDVIDDFSHKYRVIVPIMPLLTFGLKVHYWLKNMILIFRKHIYLSLP